MACQNGNYGLAPTGIYNPYQFGPYAPAANMLLAQQAQMNLPPRTGPTAPPGAPPPGPPGCWPAYYPPGCSPCPPAPGQAEAQMAQYQAECAAQEADVRRATRQQIIAGKPKIPLGIGNVPGTVVTAGTPFTFTATPSVPMCGVQFLVDSVISDFFLVTSIRIGRQELLADGIGVPASTFSTLSQNTPLMEFPELWAGTPLTVTAFNRDGADHPFNGQLWGVPTGQPGPCLR